MFESCTSTLFWSWTCYTHSSCFYSHTGGECECRIGKSTNPQDICQTKNASGIYTSEISHRDDCFHHKHSHADSMQFRTVHITEGHVRCLSNRNHRR